MGICEVHWKSWFYSADFGEAMLKNGEVGISSGPQKPIKGYVLWASFSISLFVEYK
jgi:hypothetical protein